MQLTPKRSRRLLGLAALGWILAAGAPAASAYPQFQFSTDNTRCSLCHFSPVGGGLINDYGRSEAAETISHLGGDGRLLHGLWDPPGWLAIGGDYRGAGAVKNRSGEEPRFLGFPMQLDLYTRLALPAKLSLNATVGVRGAARPDEAPPVAERIVSREHYVMWRPRRRGRYARIGRFFAPYGLRLHDHTAYIRRYMGYYVLEEPLAVSYGDVQSAREYHATLYAPAPLWSAGPKRWGGAFLYERRVHGDSGQWGAQGRFDITGNDERYIAGGTYKRWFEGQKLLLMSELNLALQRFTYTGADASPRLQVAAYASGTYFLKPSIQLGLALERYDADLFLSKSTRDSITFNAQYFVYAHVELHLLGRLEFAGGAAGEPAQLGLLMLHYYL